MRTLMIRSAVLSVLGAVALLAYAAGTLPAPPIKTGLWEVTTKMLDADGKPQTPPEQAALANMPPELRARMEEMMKARGASLPDANGATKVCHTKDSFNSGSWQALAASAGCTTDFSGQSGNNWKFHSSCAKLQAESDGEVVFSDPEHYSSKVTTKSSLMGKQNTQTRVMEAHWVGANCGDVKPLTAEGLSGR